MGYMALPDYRSYIQAQYFTQLLQADDGKRVIAEGEALAIIRGKIQQRYDVSTEFTQTLPWNPATASYGARSRVIIDYADYDPTATYAPGACVIENETGYVCTTAIITPEAFNSAHWTTLGPQYSIYFVSYPATCTYPATLAEPNAPVFNLYNYFNAGDIVFWKGYSYSCVTPTIMISPRNLKRFFQYKNIPNYNVFPDDAVNNAQGQFWLKGAAYTVAAGTPPTDADVWTLGDNRDQQLTHCMKAIVIYILSPLLSPRNTVTEWADRYEAAMHSLKQMAEGNVTVDIPEIQPMMGMMTSYGGNVKLKNRY